MRTITDMSDRELGPREGFRRARIRDLFHSAPGPSSEGWQLVGPRGLVADRLQTATTPLRRMRGLLGRRELRHGEALIIQPCHEVHTVGLRFAIDAVFCDRELKVVAVETLRPGRVSRPHLCWCCIELPAGTAGELGIVAGAQLELVRPEESESP